MPQIQMFLTEIDYRSIKNCDLPGCQTPNVTDKIF